ncbi:mechanosensitive ion channel domain-containing protein [Bailinhaonella thermotolerans]|nr:mechanosensitive ion channel domain-containing protein [Bailinhaonella thermotolerans]
MADWKFWRFPMFHRRGRHVLVLYALATLALIAAQIGEPSHDWRTRIFVYAMTLVFLVLGFRGTLSLGAEARDLLAERLGVRYAGSLRTLIIVFGNVIIVLTALATISAPIQQLLLGGAVTGVIVGIAAQQALSNVFAGLVLLYTRPFSAGDRIRVRSGPLAGEIVGQVRDMGLTYVWLVCDDGELRIPNSQVLASAVGHLPN